MAFASNPYKRQRVVRHRPGFTGRHGDKYFVVNATTPDLRGIIGAHPRGVGVDVLGATAMIAAAIRLVHTLAMIDGT